jgi:hypothetical protein
MTLGVVLERDVRLDNGWNDESEEVSNYFNFLLLNGVFLYNIEQLGSTNVLVFKHVEHHVVDLLPSHWQLYITQLVLNYLKRFRIYLEFTIAIVLEIYQICMTCLCSNQFRHLDCTYLV